MSSMGSPLLDAGAVRRFRHCEPVFRRIWFLKVSIDLNFTGFAGGFTRGLIPFGLLDEGFRPVLPR